MHLVGHSFGGSVALKAAELLGNGVARMILLEPNPSHLLLQAGRTDLINPIVCEFLDGG